MRNFYTLLLLLISMQVCAQKWALPSSVWKTVESGGFPGSTYFFDNKVLADTLVAGQLCKKIGNTQNVFHQTITFERNDTVFVYNNGQFHSVMYFNAQLDDTIPIYDYYGIKFGFYHDGDFKDTVWAKIVKIDSIDVGNKFLKRFYYSVISPSYIIDMGFPDYLNYVEFIGGNYVLPFFAYNIGADFSYYYNCDYGDELIDGFFVYNNKCNKISTQEHKLSFEIFPNPSDDFIHIKLPANTNVKSVQIVDLLGKSLFSGNYSEMISVRNLPAGVYVLVMQIQDQVLHQTFIKK